MEPSKDIPKSDTQPLTEQSKDVKDQKPEPLSESQNPKSELKDTTDDILNDCLPSNHKLNLTADEKDELEDLEDPVNDAEYENFIRSLDTNEQAKSLLNQLGNMFGGMEGGAGQFSEPPVDHPMFGAGFDQNNFEDMTNQMLGNFLQKDVIYDPLKEAKAKLEDFLKTEPKTDAEQQKRVNDQKIYGLVNELIALFDKPDHDSKENKEVIMNKFEELHDLGGLPTEIMGPMPKDMPNLGQFMQGQGGPGMPPGGPGMGGKDGCSIF